MQELNQGVAEFAHAPYNFNFAGNKASIKQNSAEAYNARGIVHAKKGEYDLAVADFSKALKLDPNYADAYCNRGIAYDSKSEVGLAIKDYNKAIQLKPNHAEAYNNRGITYSTKKRV